MSLEANLADLEGHARDLERREGFTYSILDGHEVAYIYPTVSARHDASVKPWVRQSRSDMDVIVWRSLAAWIGADWPFVKPDHAPRDQEES